MYLEVEYEDLRHIINVVKVAKGKYKSKDSAVHLILDPKGCYFAYASESFMFKYKCPFISEFKGQFGLPIEFFKNVLNIFNDGQICFDFRDNVVVAHQDGMTFKSQVYTKVNHNPLIVNQEELEEIPLKLTLSNKLLNLSLEELGFEDKDPYIHLYNISGNKLIKMSSFCALLQTLQGQSSCTVTLTQDILSICSVIDEEVKYYKYYDSFYIKGEKVEVRMPLANLKFPDLSVIIDRIKQGSQNILLKTQTLLDICEKCYALNLKRRVDIAFKEGLILYDYNGVLNGSVESGINLDWRMSFNPWLMRGILRYINEECVIICKNQGNNILVHNSDKTIVFLLALCQ